jgi:membrane-associated protease RseP (regulator of RpoE activity)
MKNEMRTGTLSRLLVILLLLLPLMILFLLPGGGWLAGGLWFWTALLLCWWLIWALLGTPKGEIEKIEEEHALRALPEPEQPEAVREVMNVRLATEEAGVQVFRGRLRESAGAAFEKLKRAFSPKRVPLLQEDEKLGAAIVLLPRKVEEEKLEKPVRPWVHWLLFGLTALTTTWAGAAHQGIDLLREPARFAVGLPYSIGLLTILGVHELGHYFMARRHGMNVTPPYFIPVPFALGTFGAFIQMRSPPENRRALFDVVIAGPLAGLAVAIPALLIGLRSSTILPGEIAQAPSFAGGTSAGSSILFALLAKLSLGDALQFGHVLRLSPLAFAGWLGVFITALNLLPIGTLDGGHAARALFGTRIGQTISSIAVWSLFLLALFVWPGLMMWALIAFFIAGTGTPPLNDLTPITPVRRWVGYATFLILALILIPLPHTLWSAAGIHCPYL